MINSFLLTIVIVASIICLYMTLWFGVSVVLKRNDVADIAWGLGFILAAFTPLILYGTWGARTNIISLLVILWGLRLAVHIINRNKGKSEDYRYQKWRQDWGEWFLIRSYLQVYLLQGVLMLIIVSPTLLVNSFVGGRITLLDWFGVIVWLIGFIFETVSDWQLLNFKRNPKNKGRIITTGLWKYSRHPNYFGEVVLWWGIYIISLSVPYGWITIYGPLTITVLILFVSGIPLLEAKMKGRKDFEDYSQKTSIFIPLPPRKS